MMYVNASYADLGHTTINVDINGITNFVPCVQGNSDYTRLQELVAAGELVIAPYLPPPPAPTPTLTRRQLRLGLLGLGVTSAQVEGVIATLPEPDRSVALIEWQDASVYQREHPLVAQIGAALGLTTEALDAAWVEAASL
jgi:hypothetical protein